MSKVTALKKANSDSKTMSNENKSARIPSVEIPGSIMIAVQKYVKDKGCSMAQFWREAASLYLQAEEFQPAREKLDRILEQIAWGEARLGELEEKEKYLAERELRIEELEQSQNDLIRERLAEIERMAKEMEAGYQSKLAEVEEALLKNEAEYRARVNNIENEIRERSQEYRRHLELDFRDKEKDLMRREARLEVREEVASEKEKFWTVMYDSIVKLTRVCGTLK